MTDMDDVLGWLLVGWLVAVALFLVGCWLCCFWPPQIEMVRYQELRRQ